jgi:hypothetical protein
VVSICVSVQAETASLHPGQGAVYKVSVWPENGQAGDVTVQISAMAGDATPALPDPTFTYCGVGQGTQTCDLGGMRVNQATQLQAEVIVPSSAHSGDTATLVAKVTAAAPGATAPGSVTGSATADVVATPPTSSKPTPTPTHTSSGSGGGQSGSGGNTSPLGNLPLPTSGGGTGTGSTGVDPSGLFPTIGPSGSSGPTGGATGTKTVHTPYRATSVADVLPLNSGQLSGQAAGLIVLGIGIILVFARISLRKPKASQHKE